MKIYEITFSQKVKIDKSQLSSIDYIGMGLEQEGFVESWENVKIHVGANDIVEALSVGSDYLDENILDEFEIISLFELEDVEIVNWAGENEPCQCPFCKAERVPKEDVMIFECPMCSTVLKVVDSGWESIGCTKCNVSILRDRLYSIGGGKYKFIKAKEE